MNERANEGGGEQKKIIANLWWWHFYGYAWISAQCVWYCWIIYFLDSFIAVLCFMCHRFTMPAEKLSENLINSKVYLWIRMWNKQSWKEGFCQRNASRAPELFEWFRDECSPLYTVTMIMVIIFTQIKNCSFSCFSSNTRGQSGIFCRWNVGRHQFSLYLHCVKCVFSTCH